MDGVESIPCCHETMNTAALSEFFKKHQTIYILLIQFTIADNLRMLPMIKIDKD